MTISNRANQRTVLLLISLIQSGGRDKPVSLSDLAEFTGIPKPTLVRWFKEAENGGYVIRAVKGKRHHFIVSVKGFALLNGVCELISSGEKPIERIAGEVFTGLGEGAYYMSLEGYRREFLRHIGYEPFKGTLNMRVISKSAIYSVIKWIEKVKPAIVPGFTESGRTFGSVRIYPIRLNGELCHAIFPERRHYNADVIEVISKDNLRRKLNLKDGDIVTVDLLSWD
jgi:riboflavin kinase